MSQRISLSFGSFGNVVCREILREIQELEAMRLASGGSETGLSSELDTLRHRKLELERRMQRLQDTRHDLMRQLETLMRLLKVRSRARASRGPIRTGTARHAA